jgi:arginase
MTSDRHGPTPVIGVLAAPTNLGLRPPEPGSVPGCAKAPEALRQAGLYAHLRQIGAIDVGVVLPGRYRDDAEPGVPRLRNQNTLLDHTRRLAERLAGLLDQDYRPLVLGGDCSVLIGAGLALARRGHYGLVHLDGHTDFRHPGNTPHCHSLAGEDLAAAVGLHWANIADINGHSPYFRPADVAHIGCRDDDDHLDEVRQLLGAVIPSSQLRHDGTAPAEHFMHQLRQRPHLNGVWLHLDVDILDPEFMPAVDSPTPGGLNPDELTRLLAVLAPHAIGAQITVFDPDLDPDGRYARLLTDILAVGLKDFGAQR